MTPLLTASRISNGLTMAPLVNTSICRRPPDILLTFDAKLLSSVMCGVPAGFALCIFQRNCAACDRACAGTRVAPAAATPAALMNSRRFMALLLGFVDGYRVPN